MTGPDSAPRRRRRSNRSTRSAALRRVLLAVGLIAAIVIIVGGVSLILGGTGVPPDGPFAIPSVSPSTTDFPAVPTPGSTDVVSFPPVPTELIAPSPSVAAATGIRAKRIQIARLGIDLRIVEGDGIDAPIGKAAHYPGTGWPDGGTNIYIYGHARTGMFLPLWNAAVGDRVVLTLVDGTKRTYIVDKVLPKVPWDAVKYLDPTPTEQLTLQTSTSYYGTAPRFVVIAHPAR